MIGQVRKRLFYFNVWKFLINALSYKNLLNTIILIIFVFTDVLVNKEFLSFIDVSKVVQDSGFIFRNIHVHVNNYSVLIFILEQKEKIYYISLFLFIVEVIIIMHRG